MLKFQKGFTLAEVLITLAIIGVVAALTIPVVVRNYQKTQTVVRLKKVYTTLANTTNLIISEEGAVKGWATSKQNIYRLYKPKLKILKECAATAGCFEQTPVKHLNDNQSGDWNNLNYYKIILADGTQVMFNDVISADCDLNNNINRGSIDYCTDIIVDINGTKPPNRIGRDIFDFVLKEKGIEPAGCDIENLCNKNSSGHACTCKIIRENAINY